MRECPYQMRLSAYIDGELEASAAGALRAHLPGCAPCARELEQLQSLSHLLSAEPPRAFVDAAMARLHTSAADVLAQAAEREPAKAPRDVLPLVRVLMAMAASVVVIGGAWLVALQPQPGQRSTRTPDHTIAIDPSASRQEPWERLAGGGGFDAPLGSRDVALPTDTALVDKFIQDSLGDFASPL